MPVAVEALRLVEALPLSTGIATETFEHADRAFAHVDESSDRKCGYLPTQLRVCCRHWRLGGGATWLCRPRAECRVRHLAYPLLPHAGEESKQGQSHRLGRIGDRRRRLNRSERFLTAECTRNMLELLPNTENLHAQEDLRRKAWKLTSCRTGNQHEDVRLHGEGAPSRAQVDGAATSLWNAGIAGPK